MVVFVCIIKRIAPDFVYFMLLLMLLLLILLLMRKLYSGRIAQSVEHSANNAAVQGSSSCMTSIGSSLAKQGSTLIGEHICEFIFKDSTYYEYLLRIFTKLCLTKHFVLNSDWQSK